MTKDEFTVGIDEFFIQSRVIDCQAECKHRMYDSEICNQKTILIDADGKCHYFEKMTQSDENPDCIPQITNVSIDPRAIDQVERICLEEFERRDNRQSIRLNCSE